MTNLWEETINLLGDHGKSFEDVLFIRGDDFGITKDNFEEVAKKSDYYSGYGAQHIAKDLALVGKDWWIERDEYDGAEWWKFKTIPIRCGNVETITKLDKGMWDTIKEMNEVQDDSKI